MNVKSEKAETSKIDEMDRINKILNTPSSSTDKKTESKTENLNENLTDEKTETSIESKNENSIEQPDQLKTITELTVEASENKNEMSSVQEIKNKFKELFSGLVKGFKKFIDLFKLRKLE